MIASRKTRATVPSNTGWTVRVRAACGFTLIELAIVVAVMGILGALAAPSMMNVLLGSKLSSYANSLVASSHLARSEAIKRNSAVQLCISSDGVNCAGSGSWEQGWIVKSGTNVLQHQTAASSGIKVIETAALTTLTFDATGIGATQASLKVCRATPSVGTQERVVTVSATGRASVKKTTLGTCA